MLNTTLRTLSIYCIPVLCCLLSLAVTAQSEDELVPAVPLEMTEPVYPEEAEDNDQEGLVVVMAMVGTDGKTSEAQVMAASGPESMKAAALEALASSTFTPATINGEAIQSRIRYKYAFNTGRRNTTPGSQFANRYRFFVTKMSEQNDEEIDEALDRLTALGTTNLYEVALLNMAKFMYAQRSGSEAEQMDYLTRALSFTTLVDDGQGIHIPAEVAVSARGELFRLLVKHARFGEAVAVFDTMMAADEEAAALFNPTYQEVLKLKEGDSFYPVKGMLDEEGSWIVEMFRHSIGFLEVKGQLDSVKLWCSKGYGDLEVETGLTYNIPDSWGDCTLQVLGEPGTTLSLIQ